MVHKIEIKKEMQVENMEEEYKLKSSLIRTFLALVLCFVLIIIKFVFKEEKIVEEVYNYLASDIVFLK